MARRPELMPDGRQLSLNLFPFRNRNFLSNHWLEQRLHLEPEWHERREAGQQALKALQKLWSVQATRVELYGNEAGLEHGLIQPVLHILGWQIKYQAFLMGASPTTPFSLTMQVSKRPSGPVGSVLISEAQPRWLQTPKRGTSAWTGQAASAVDASTRPSRSSGI